MRPLRALVTAAATVTALLLLSRVGPVAGEPTLPTLDHSSFLASHPDQPVRDALWAYFQPAEMEAQQFPLGSGCYVPISSVIESGGNFGSSDESVCTESVGACWYHEPSS